MNPPEPAPQTELERRVAALEALIALTPARETGVAPVVPRIHPVWALLLAAAALGCAYLGMGLPQHYYQPMFAALLLAVGYHRRMWIPASTPWRWPLVIVNFVLLCFLFKLLIGAGTSYPFHWMQVPSIGPGPASHQGSWFSRAIPNLEITWRGIPGVSDWHYDLTQVQSLLLIATFIGAVFRFQPFASFTALVLLIVSIPTLAGFNWDWLIPFLVLGGTAVYLQTEPPSP